MCNSEHVSRGDSICVQLETCFSELVSLLSVFFLSLLALPSNIANFEQSICFQLLSTHRPHFPDVKAYLGTILTLVIVLDGLRHYVFCCSFVIILNVILVDYSFKYTQNYQGLFRTMIIRTHAHKEKPSMYLCVADAVHILICFPLLAKCLCSFTRMKSLQCSVDSALAQCALFGPGKGSRLDLCETDHWDLWIPPTTLLLLLLPLHKRYNLLSY